MTWAVKFLVVAVLAAGAVAVFFLIRSSNRDTDNSVQPAGEKQIGASLQKALALLDAMPQVPALKPLLEVAPVPKQSAVVIEQRAQIRFGDISSMRRDLPLALARFEAGVASEHEVNNAISTAYRSNDKSLVSLDKWVAEEPVSYAALVARGIVKSHLGWHARGGDYIPYTPKENLAEMTRLHLLALDDFILALDKSRYPVLVISELLSISKAHGWKEESKKLFLAGERLSPSSDTLFSRYSSSLYEEWGTGSVVAAKAFLRRAEENGVSLEARSALTRQLANAESGWRYSIGKPDALAYAVEFSKRHDTVDAWWWRSQVESSLDRHEDALKSLRRVVEKQPDSAGAMGDIAGVLRQLNRIEDFKLARRRTADLGNDWAQGQIIADMIWERNGEKRDWEKIRKECEASAEMLNPSGQHCVGGLYMEGLAGYPRDNAKSVAYYELAARQGDDRAQHDYGWSLIQGSGVKQDREKGLFYLRNSARQKFEPALNKLKQLGERTDNLEWRASKLESAKRDLEVRLDRGETWRGRY